MFKRLLSLFLVFVFSIILVIPSFAATPTINYWYSDYNRVGYTLLEGSYCTYNLVQNDSTFASRFNTAVAHAEDVWDAVLPLSIFSAPANYALYSIYGGTWSQLYSIFPDLLIDDAGLTSVNFTGTTHTVKYNNTNKTVERLSVGQTAIIKRASATQANYTNIATHEMGHMFGWIGHSSYTGDVMYAYESSNITLTNRDKRQIKQIYNLFYS